MRERMFTVRLLREYRLLVYELLREGAVNELEWVEFMRRPRIGWQMKWDEGLMEGYDVFTIGNNPDSGSPPLSIVHHPARVSS